MASATTAPALRRLRLRALWQSLHRWIGLTLGLLLVANGLSGAALVFGRDVDRQFHPELFAAADPSAAARADLYAHAVALLQQRHGADVALTLRPPREPGDTLWVFVDTPGWHGTAYLDPASGQLLGERSDTEGVFGWLFEWHSSLLGLDGGPPLLALAALAYLVLLVSGIVLWWPRVWRRAFALRRQAGAQALLFDLHRGAGVLLGLPVAIAVASGAYMAWRPIGQTVSAVAGPALTVPPKVDGAENARASADELIALAQREMPGAMLSYVGWPAVGTASPVRVRLKRPDDPHPNGLSSVWLHPASGEILRVDRWDALDAGSRAYAWIYPLHTGALGGTWHRAINVLLGLSLASIGAVGIALWWKRRR